MKNKNQWLEFFWRITSCHVLSYFILGILSSIALNYGERFTAGTLSLFMRSTDSPWVALGPGLQLIRGLIFSIVLWPFKEQLLAKKRGWLALWGLFIGLAILGTSGPTPGSIEGIIYTKVSLSEHISFLPEIIIQTLLFSLGVYYWYKRPSKTWNIVMGICVALIIFMSTAGFLVA